MEIALTILSCLFIWLLVCMLGMWRIVQANRRDIAQLCDLMARASKLATERVGIMAGVSARLQALEGEARLQALERQVEQRARLN